MSRFIAVKEAKLWIYPLAMTNIAMVEPWPIEIDGLPNLKMVIFHDFPWQTVK